eukprot:Opistho-2@80415
MASAKVINFYSERAAYGCFSNFSRHPLRIEGKEWPTSEHFFQAMKFAGTVHEEEVRACPSPGEAAKLGRCRSLPLRKDWDSVKDDIMRAAVLAKFTQNEDIRSTLIETDGSKLVEHTRNDSYWGDGGDGSGRNMLGIILMETRDTLLGKTAR